MTPADLAAVSSECGIVIRRSALEACSLSVETVSELFRTPPLALSESLVSFGPCFGRDAAEALAKELERLGLEDVDDFFILDVDVPAWCVLFAGHSE